MYFFGFPKSAQVPLRLVKKILFHFKSSVLYTRTHRRLYMYREFDLPPPLPATSWFLDCSSELPPNGYSQTKILRAEPARANRTKAVVL